MCPALAKPQCRPVHACFPTVPAMIIAGWEFKPGLGPSLFAAAAILLTLFLGDWQLGRAGEKSRLQQRLDALSAQPAIHLPAGAFNSEQLVFRRVEAEGKFDPRHMIYLDNRVYRGTPGYHIIMPLQIGDSKKYVLVNRGWVGGTGQRSNLPQITTPVGAVKIAGIALVPSPRVFELSGQTVEGQVWQNLLLERYRLAAPLDIQPVVIQQENDTSDGLVREWERPDTGIRTHQGYAFQWFTMSIAILIIYLVVNVKRIAQKEQQD